MFTTEEIVIDRFLSIQSETIFREGYHVCIGVSPFNSYFSENTLVNLISWAQIQFDSFHLFIPDEPAIYTLMAMGYSEKESIKKMKKQNRYLKNKVKRALAINGIYHENYILNWEILSKNSTFNQIYNDVLDYFEWDSEFRNACIGASKWVLENRVEESKLTDSVLELAVQYFLAECPLFLKTANIVGVESSIFCYHQSPPFLIDLFENKLSIEPDENQGYVALKPFEI